MLVHHAEKVLRKRQRLFEKLTKSVSYLFIGLLFLYIVFRTPWVQTFLTNRIMAYLKKAYGVEIKVGGVDFEPISYIELEDILVTDYRNDTLLYVHELELSLSNLDIENRKAEVQLALCEEAHFEYWVDSSRNNLNEFIRRFGEQKKTADTSIAWDIKINNIKLINANLQYTVWNKQKQEQGINFKDIKVDSLYVKIDSLTLGDTIKCNIRKMGLREQSGLRLKRLDAHLEIAPTSISLSELRLRTMQSNIISPRIALHYDSMSYFSDFLNKVRLETEFTDSSHIHLNDIIIFAPAISGMQNNIGIQGKINGTISRLRGDSLYIRFGKETAIYLRKFRLDGLPDANAAFMSFDIMKLTTSAKDVGSFKLPGGSTIPLPDQMQRMGQILYRGKVTGMFSSMVFDGRLTTDIGRMLTDIKLDVLNNGGVRVKGRFDEMFMSLGKFTGNENLLGNIQLKADASIETGNNDSINIDFNGNIQRLDFSGYAYKDITAVATYNNKVFDGKVTINDPNLQLLFNGLMDFSTLTPVFKFGADLKHADLRKLKLDNTPELSTLKMSITTDFAGSGIDDMLGQFEIKDIRYTRNTDLLIINRLTLRADTLGSFDGIMMKQLSLKSDVADGELTGAYEFKSLSESVKQLIDTYLPALRGDTAARTVRIQRTDVTDGFTSLNSFDFILKPKRTSLVTRMFMPSLRIDSKSAISGNYDANTQLLNIECHLPKFSIYDQYFDDLDLFLFTDTNSLNINLQSKKMKINQKFSLNNFSFNNTIKSDTVITRMNWFNDVPAYHGGLSAQTYFFRTSPKNLQIEINLDSSKVFFADSTWVINGSQVVIDSNYISINYLGVSNNKQHFNVNGVVSQSADDTLYINIDNLDLSQLNRVTQPNGLTIKGIANGEIRVSRVLNTPIVKSSATIDDMTINDQFFGDFSVNTDWDDNLQMMTANILARDRNVETLKMNGFYFPADTMVDFKGSFNSMKVKMLQPYMTGALSDMSGWVDGYFDIYGTLNNPIYNAVLKMRKVGFTVDYLKTRIGLSDSVFINNSVILFDSTEIIEPNSGEIIANGNIFHDNFSKIKFDVRLDAKRFMFMNTQEGDNDYFYGKTLATGVIKLTGTPEHMVVDVSVRTDAGTKLAIPLSSGAEASENDFIVFVNKNDTTSQTDEVLPYKAKTSSIQMNFDVEVTPEAEMMLIFDTKTGEIITAKGVGDINLKISTLGDFAIYGNYTLEQGEYLFTLKNVISKKFVVEKGGVLKWTGDPLDASVDIAADYKLKKVPLYDLLMDEEHKDEKTNVDCRLMMKEKLMSPTITFDLHMPEAGDQLTEQIQQLSPDDLNKQVISLLVMNRFQPLPGLAGAGANYNLSLNTDEFLSNQLSHWLSQISSDVDIGVNYQTGDSISSSELELMLGTQFLDDKLSVNGNLVMGGGMQNSSNLLGDVNVEYKINDRLRVKAYNRPQDDLLGQTVTSYEQGVGLFFKRDFNRLRELWRKENTGEDDKKKPQKK